MGDIPPGGGLKSVCLCPAGEGRKTIKLSPGGDYKTGKMFEFSPDRGKAGNV